MRLGQNLLETYNAGDRPAAQLPLVNFAVTGPIFSGPQEQPFICESQTFRLPDGNFLGSPVDANCSVKTVVTYVYRPAGPGGLPDPAVLRPLPARMFCRRMWHGLPRQRAAKRLTLSASKPEQSTRESTRSPFFTIRLANPIPILFILPHPGMESWFTLLAAAAPADGTDRVEVSVRLSATTS